MAILRSFLVALTGHESPPYPDIVLIDDLYGASWYFESTDVRARRHGSDLAFTAIASSSGEAGLGGWAKAGDEEEAGWGIW